MERKKEESLSSQMKKKVEKPVEKEEVFTGNFKTVISTGSTLGDLAISGKRIRGGGLPGGIFVEAFGPSQSGKTAFLSSIAGKIEEKKGENQFNDPEARLDEEFTRIFGMHIPKKNYHQPDTVTQLFENIRNWDVTDLNVVNGIFGDSLTALSTQMEMENDDGDKMGGRRAKEFSEGLRKTCRILKQNNYLFVASNQIRMNMDANKYSPKFRTSGGEAIKFYASVRLKFNNPKKITETHSFNKKDIEKVIGIETEIEVIKTVDDPFRTFPLIIIYGYGIDDIRANLQYLKKYRATTVYCLGEHKLSNDMDEAIRIVEDSNAENDLREEVINLWGEIEEKFVQERKPKIQ
jgi:RecA/RadA recombinase